MTKARQCGNKRQHEHKSQAMRHRFALIQQGAHPGRLWAYRCGECGYWHVGHQKRRRRAN